MSWNARIRQIHRWLSIIFTLAVTANLIAVALKQEQAWIGLLALFPLILLMISGLYMFVLPHVRRRLAKGSMADRPPFPPWRYDIRTTSVTRRIEGPAGTA
jgi:hypothetical protein